LIKGKCLRSDKVEVTSGIVRLRLGERSRNKKPVMFKGVEEVILHGRRDLDGETGRKLVEKETRKSGKKQSKF